MKRARLRPAHLLGILSILLAAAAGRADAETGPLGWVNAVRRAAGAPSVSADAVLSGTARKWALVLAASGMLSHRGVDGSSVLDRYRAQGGTEARVGEILGAGPGLAAVEKGWMASPDHRTLALDPAWTHIGWGMAVSGTAEVWVVLFCEKLVQDLQVDRGDGALKVRGAFIPRQAARALLYNGLDALEPAEWDQVTRRFGFTVPRTDIAGYFRLGYVTSTGAFRLTNAFTLPPETGSPEAPGRS